MKRKQAPKTQRTKHPKRRAASKATLRPLTHAVKAPEPVVHYARIWP